GVGEYAGAAEHEGARAALGAQPAEGAQAGAIARVAAPALDAGEAGAMLKGKTKRIQALAQMSGGEDAAEAVNLGAIGEAGPENAVSAYFKSLFSQLPDAQRDRLTAACDKQNICDPVEACQYAKLVRQCRDLCGADPKCAASGILKDLKEAMNPHKHRTGWKRLKHKAGI
ncbi:MAG: hypothetical protein HY925_13135, partial [Elusimicrobia bacterium]|nr:hypothetical protein [Elusimicrobiota bacterium]